MFQRRISPSPPPDMKLNSESDIEGGLSSHEIPPAIEACPLYSRIEAKSGSWNSCNCPDQFAESRNFESDELSSSLDTGQNLTDDTALAPPNSDNNGANVCICFDSTFRYRII